MKIRYLKLFAFVIPILIVGIGFAMTQVTFNNTSTITAGQSIFITQPTFTTQVCPAHGDATYKNTGLTPLAWSFTQGGAAVTAFFCIDNQGTALDAPSVTASGTGIALGGCPSTTSTLIYGTSGVPVTLAAGAATATPITLDICAGSNIVPGVGGTGPSFAVTVT
jgi:hypothetical protein